MMMEKDVMGMVMKGMGSDGDHVTSCDASMALRLGTNRALNMLP